jgi:hypothetical protein
MYAQVSYRALPITRPINTAPTILTLWSQEVPRREFLRALRGNRADTCSNSIACFLYMFVNNTKLERSPFRRDEIHQDQISFRTQG